MSDEERELERQDAARDVAAALAQLSRPGSIWAVEQSALEEWRAILAAGRSLPPFLPPRPAVAGGAFFIPVVGPIERRSGPLTFALGGTSVQEVSEMVDMALADDRAQRIVLHVDSPGGSVDGVAELAATIRAARSRKEVVAFVDTMAASAAYWIAAQASQVVVTPSGSVGSIGVFALHVDRSRELEMRGLEPTFIHAGRYKVEANSLEPLEDDAREELQRRVDAFMTMFVDDVALGRGVSSNTVRTLFGEGRMVLARDAVRVGMVDLVSAKIPPARAKSITTASAAIPTPAPMPFVYVEVPERELDSEYVRLARHHFDSALLDLGIYGQGATLHFFRPEQPDDDADRRRIRSAINIAGQCSPARREAWVRVGLPTYRGDRVRSPLESTVRHEARHLTHGRVDEDTVAEADARAFAETDPLAEFFGKWAH